MVPLAISLGMAISSSSRRTRPTLTPSSRYLKITTARTTRSSSQTQMPSNLSTRGRSHQRPATRWGEYSHLQPAIPMQMMTSLGSLMLPLAMQWGLPTTKLLGWALDRLVTKTKTDKGRLPLQPILWATAGARWHNRWLLMMRRIGRLGTM